VIFVDIKKAYAGGTVVSKILVGATLLWPLSPFPLDLVVPANPVVSASTSVLTMNPVAIQGGDLEVPGVPTVSVTTAVYDPLKPVVPLIVPAVPIVTVSATKIEETPVTVEAALAVPSCPTVSVTTEVTGP
jgi:hypothetical protein